MEIDPTVKSTIKIVVVGDKLVGKSCAITTFITSHAPLQRQSTVFDSSSSEIIIDGKKYALSIWDTTGNQTYHGLIQSCYKDAQIIFIFFSVIDPETFKNAVQKWYPETTRENPKALVYFVGNKVDQRQQQSTGAVVSKIQAQKKIEQELKRKYMECSALTNNGIKAIFQAAVKQDLIMKGIYKSPDQKVVSKPRKPNQNNCCNMM